MTDRWARRLAATFMFLALAAPMTAPLPALAQRRTEHVRLEMLPLRPAMTAPATSGDIAGLLSVPPSWTVLDAAAILIDDPAWPAAARDRLRDVLLDQGAAVLEFDPRAAGVGADSAFAAQPPGAPDLLSGLFGALLALKGGSGAGLVVAFGFGDTGEAALPAAAEATADRHLGFPRGPEGPRFAALGLMGPGRPAFATGSVPVPAAEHWPTRAPLLCAILAEAVTEATGNHCLAALLPRRPAPADAAPGPLAAGR